MLNFTVGIILIIAFGVLLVWGLKYIISDDINLHKQ
jgi:hypothetical protein